MNPIFLQIGQIQIYWYSVMILIGMIIALIYILKESKKFNIDKDFIINLFVYAIPIALIGARTYFVIFHLDYYLNNLSEILAIWEGGLAIHGGIIAGLIFVILYCKKHNQNIWRILDIATIGLIIGQIIGRWGNFFNQEAYGSPTTLAFLQNLHLPKFIIDGMYIDGIYYHPTFLYESLWNLIGLIILLVIRKNKKLKIGQLTSIYMIWYGFGRFLIESMRQDSLMLGNFKIAQIVSLIMFILGIFITLYKSKKEKLLYNGDGNNGK